MRNSETLSSHFPAKTVAFALLQTTAVLFLLLLTWTRREPTVLLTVNQRLPAGATLTVPERVVFRGTLSGNQVAQLIILVKPLQDDQPWYVRDQLVIAEDNTFEVVVHCGDNRTQKGTQFLLAAASVDESLEPGTVIRDVSELPITVDGMPELPSIDNPLLVARR